MTEKRAVMAFGRMNPPTTGHEKLMHAVHKEAKRQGASAHVIASHSHDKEKNPIHPHKKLGYLKKVAPKGVNVSVSSKEHPTLLHHASRLHAAGHDHLTVVAAGDREKEFHSLLHKYNGKKGSHGHYNYKSIKIHSAGKRDPDAEGTEGISGTKMRAHAKSNDHKSFKKGLPKALHPHAHEIMKHVNEEIEEIVNFKLSPFQQRAFARKDPREQPKTKRKKMQDKLHGAALDRKLGIMKRPSRADEQFEEYITEKKAEGGFAYERQVNGHLQKHGLQKKGQGSAGSSTDAPDGTIHASGKHHNLEIKQNKSAMMGQIGLHHDGKSWKVKASSKRDYPKTAKHIEKNFLPHINEKIGKPSGDYHKDRKKHGNIYHTVTGTHAIRDHYGKDRKTPYMQIGGSGLHHTDKDHGKLGTKPLNGDTQYRMRVKNHGTNKKTGKVNYSHTVVFNLHKHEKSHIDIDHHAKDIAKKHAMNESTILEGPYLSGPTVTPSARKDAPFTGTIRSKKDIKEKILTAAEKRKREEVAQAIKRDNPNMPMDKKMAIATSVAKKANEAFEDFTNEGEIDEALTYKQRIQRKMIMRRHRPKMIRAKRMMARRKAPEKNIAQRARKAAIRAIRKRVAGKKGVQYYKLTPQEKIMVDQRVAKKQAIVNRIAKRMLPVMRKAELIRLKSRGTKKVNEVFSEYINLLETPTPVSVDVAKKTPAFKTKEKYKEINARTANKRPAKAQPTVEETIFKFVDSIMCNDYVLSEKEVKKLTEKAIEHNVPYSVLKEVYDAGIQEWDKNSRHTPQQVAWNKLNAFLARPDLVEYVLDWGTPEATAFWKKATPGESGDGYRPVAEISAKTASEYSTKASDARGHRKLSTKKVDNRYSGVKLAHDKLAKSGHLGTTAKKVSKAKVGVSEDDQFEAYSQQNYNVKAGDSEGKRKSYKTSYRIKQDPKKQNKAFPKAKSAVSWSQENYQSMGSGATTNAGTTGDKVIQSKKKVKQVDEAGWTNRKDPIPAGKELADLMKKQKYAFPRSRPGLKDFKKNTTKTVKENAPQDQNTDAPGAAAKPEPKGKQKGNVKLFLNPPMQQVKEKKVLDKDAKSDVDEGVIGKAVLGGAIGAVTGGPVGAGIGAAAGAGKGIADKIKKRRREKALDKLIKRQAAEKEAEKKVNSGQISEVSVDLEHPSGAKKTTLGKLVHHNQKQGWKISKKQSSKEGQKFADIMHNDAQQEGFVGRQMGRVAGGTIGGAVGGWDGMMTGQDIGAKVGDHAGKAVVAGAGLYAAKKIHDKMKQRKREKAVDKLVKDHEAAHKAKKPDTNEDWRSDHSDMQKRTEFLNRLKKKREKPDQKKDSKNEERSGADLLELSTKTLASYHLKSQGDALKTAKKYDKHSGTEKEDPYIDFLYGKKDAHRQTKRFEGGERAEKKLKKKANYADPLKNPSTVGKSGAFDASVHHGMKKSQMNSYEPDGEQLEAYKMGPAATLRQHQAMAKAINTLMTKAYKNAPLMRMVTPKKKESMSATEKKMRRQGYTKEEVKEDDDHHATVEYHKGTYSMPGKNDGTYHTVKKKIPLKKVDTDRGLSRSPESTNKEVSAHKIHKDMKAKGYSIKKLSYKNRPKHYSIDGGRPFARYEEKDPS